MSCAFVSKETGMVMLFLSILSKALQHYLTVSYVTNKTQNLKPKISLGIEINSETEEEMKRIINSR